MSGLISSVLQVLDCCISVINHQILREVTVTLTVQYFLFFISLVMLVITPYYAQQPYFMVVGFKMLCYGKILSR